MFIRVVDRKVGRDKAILQAFKLRSNLFHLTIYSLFDDIG